MLWAGPVGGVLAMDDPTLPKMGKCSIGVIHQYCGELGKRANCQAFVAAHYAAEKPTLSTPMHWPVSGRGFRPNDWATESIVGAPTFRLGSRSSQRSSAPPISTYSMLSKMCEPLRGLRASQTTYTARCWRTAGMTGRGGCRPLCDGQFSPGVARVPLDRPRAVS